MLSRLLLPLLLAVLSVAIAPTDEIRDADSNQSGWLWGHNIDPAIVGSSAFKILWQHGHNTNERFYAKPLIYTPPGKSQLVFTASNQNIIRTRDAVTGTLLHQRQLQPPFLASDSGCGDMPNTVGIVGTPIIDQNTNIVYMFSKGYVNGGSSGGITNARFKMYAVDINTLLDVPGFPVLIDGHHAVNDPKKYFTAANVNQRPSLIIKGTTVVAGFGSICDFFNYTGMLVGVSTTPGVGVTQVYAMEGGAGATPETNDLHGNGGEAGIWQGGMGISTDGADRIFITTGNGRGDVNRSPQTGFGPLTTLDDVVARFAVSSTGQFTLNNYFEPSDYMNLDAVDLDLGSSGFSLLDTTTFQGSGAKRIGVVAGKNSKMYILDANNLGGYKMGPSGGDHVLQTITLDAGGVWGGTGSYPLEGGYIYVTPKGKQTAAYKFQGGGVAHFSLAGKTTMNMANSVGIGTPTITSLGLKSGTGILWICDPSAGLRAFKAVPVGGVLQQITTPTTGPCNKFQRPAFGNGKVYVTDFNGNLYCLGN